MLMEAVCGILEEDYFKRQDERCHQRMTSGTRIADNIPIGTRVFTDMYSKSKPPKVDQDFMVLFVLKKLTRELMLSVYKMALKKLSIWIDVIRSKNSLWSNGPRISFKTRRRISAVLFRYFKLNPFMKNHKLLERNKKEVRSP